MIDFSNTVAQSFEPVPAGNYTALVVGAEIKQSKAGNQYVNIQWSLTDDEYENRRVFQGMHFTEKSMGTTFSNLLAMGFDEDELRSNGVELEDLVDDLIDCEAVLRLKIRDGGVTDSGVEFEPRNEVQRVIAL